MVAAWALTTANVFSGVDPMFLRICRLVRLLRMLRLTRTFQAFDVLHLLVQSLLASFNVLMWSLLLLCIICKYRTIAVKDVWK